ncbi:hypothetical protein [Rummeliibacillus sp. TYF-LIM-RU47]|nr:hypothetical protein [Rummeliibacillus sp. TYF-LIM-RU47]
MNKKNQAKKMCEHNRLLDKELIQQLGFYETCQIRGLIGKGREV